MPAFALQHGLRRELPIPGWSVRPYVQPPHHGLRICQRPWRCITPYTTSRRVALTIIRAEVGGSDNLHATYVTRKGFSELERRHSTGILGIAFGVCAAATLAVRAKFGWESCNEDEVIPPCCGRTVISSWLAPKASKHTGSDTLSLGAKQVGGVALRSRATSLPTTSTALPQVEVPSLGSPVYGSFFLHHRTVVEADAGDWDAAASSIPDQARRYLRIHGTQSISGLVLTLIPSLIKPSLLASQLPNPQL